MQSASKGLGQHFASGVRSLHGYVHPPRPPGGVGGGVGAGTHAHAHTHAPYHHTPLHSKTTSTTNVGRQIIQTTKTALTRFFAHLTAPGFTHPVADGSTFGARGLSTRVNASVRPETIQQRLSLSGRQALSRPRSGPPFIPRVPTQATRSTVQVGLGTARNFSTARPLFQQFVANVPVAGRAVYEVDWDIEKRKMKDKVRKDLKAAVNEKENVPLGSTIRTKPVEKRSKTQEFERYFPAAGVSEVATVLLVPLAPTPTSRFPLTETQSAEPTLLVVSDLQDILSSHRIHSLRVSSLFARLDACGVWDRGAKLTACGDASGLCTVLRVEFKGWTEGMVRDVMGDAGRGWCRVVEIRSDEYEDEGKTVLDDSLTSLSGSASARSISSQITMPPPEIDPSASMVLPTLDFSASFHRTCASATVSSSSGSPPPSPPLSPHLSGTSSPLPSISEFSFSPSSSPSEFEMDYAEMDDNYMDMGTEYEFDLLSDSGGSGSGSGSGSMISFSSDFMQRANGATMNEQDVFV